mgnify:CR=1 FL=1
MTAAPVVSVVICTKNRAALLPAAIASIDRPVPPTVDYEILLIDNGSTDDTAAVVRDLAHPRLTYLHEPEAGIATARNTGWQKARGDYIAYLDDDATAFPGWVDAIARAFAHDPGAGGVGGPVRPVWHAPRPTWLGDEVAHALTILDWGPSPQRIDTDRKWLVGANMAFRKSALQAAGGFDLRLGRLGSNLLSNEETFLMRQLDRLGHGILYWPSMQVHHPVPANRLDPRWLVDRHFWQGISDAVVWAIETAASRTDCVAAAAQVAARISSPDQVASIRNQTAQFTGRCRAARDAGLAAGLLAGMGVA